jgi:hypothetical protein
MRPGKRKAEDSPAGCRAFAASDRERAAASGSEHMRECLERSAEAWSARAQLLDRLEASFEARAAANAGKNWRESHDQGDQHG